MVNEQHPELAYEFEMSDWMALHSHHISHSKQYKQYFLFMKLMLPLTFVVLILKDLYLKQMSVAVITVAVILSILWLIFIPKRLKKNAEKRFLKVLNSGDNSSILGTHKIKIEDDGIHVEKPNSSGFMKWNAFNKIEQTVDHYFLYNSAISALIIPKMKLGTMGQYVHDELKKHFPDLQDLPKA
jgi:hypothetical protein